MVRLLLLLDTGSNGAIFGNTDCDMASPTPETAVARYGGKVRRMEIGVNKKGLQCCKRVGIMFVLKMAQNSSKCIKIAQNSSK